MKNCLYVIALLLTVSNLAVAEIIETAHFCEIVNYVQEDSLVVLDIDDTLLITVQALGTDVWYRSRLAKYQTQGDEAWALDKALADWEAVRHLTHVKIVEQGTDLIIKQLQKRNITVMALTTQGLGLSMRTCNQLNGLNIDLTATAPSDKDHYFMNGQGVLYRNGILFTSGTSKGQALLMLCDRVGLKPKHVVFINDKATHLKDVEGSMVAAGIRFTGLRYSYEDQRVANYRPEIAEIQWEKSSFGHILSDEEAEKLLLESSSNL